LGTASKIEDEVSNTFDLFILVRPRHDGHPEVLGWYVQDSSVK
jgi:hypothetical protein